MRGLEAFEEDEVEAGCWTAEDLAGRANKDLDRRPVAARLMTFWLQGEEGVAVRKIRQGADIWYYL